MCACSEEQEITKKNHSEVHWLEDNQKMMDGTVSKEQSQLL